MRANEYIQFATQRIYSRRDLLLSGMTGARITESVGDSQLIRVRRDHYALPETDRHTVEAVRVGGRLACVSAAAELGIFAFDSSLTHIHLGREASRLRSATSRRHRLDALPRDGIELHWQPLISPADGTEYCVGPMDALAQIIRCQPATFALAALDTALHDRGISTGDLDDIFDSVPLKHHSLRPLIDARAEAGQETVLRELVRQEGLHYALQVWFPGIGRVDVVVEGCVVVEADSKAHHKSWEEHVRDRSRDRELAQRGFVTLRLLYQDIMFHPVESIAAIRELVEICRNGSRHA
ncbi:DUF559 domain-containing protein [Leifsonia sp. A12D58]|uniref:DUF559 domain-containing protein n=1 Tax=Leifsonia sp. A12D58 TaxID=3397674 RepID=UPI0039DFFC70